jgi:hypothetical protein
VGFSLGGRQTQAGTPALMSANVDVTTSSAFALRKAVESLLTRPFKAEG